MATTNLGKVSVTPKGEYDPLITYERLDVISHNGSSYIVKQTSIGVTPIEGEFYALIAEKGDGGSFVKKAYKTYAAMDADKVNIPANSSVDITNDPDESKNGAYIYDGVAFTRSQYDSKVVTDKVIADTAIAVQNAINNTAVDGGVLAATFVTVEEQITGDGALSLRDFNSRTVLTVNSIAELLQVKATSGRTVFVKGLQGGTFVYDSSKSAINDGGLIFNGWVRDIRDKRITPEMFGAKPNDATFDNTTALNTAFATGFDLYGLSTDTYHVTQHISSRGQRTIGGWKIHAKRELYRLYEDHPNSPREWLLDESINTVDTGFDSLDKVKGLYVGTAWDLCELLMMKALGVNLILHYCSFVNAPPFDRSGSIDKLLANAKTAGLKVAIGTEHFMGLAPETMIGGVRDFTAAKSKIREIDNHPAVWGYLTLDEPDYRGISVAEQDEYIANLREVTNKNLTVVGYTANPFNKLLFSDKFDYFFSNLYSYVYNNQPLAERIELDMLNIRRVFGIQKNLLSTTKVVPCIGAFTFMGTTPSSYTSDLDQIIPVALAFGKAGNGDCVSWCWDGYGDVNVLSSVREEPRLRELVYQLSSSPAEHEYITEAYVFGSDAGEDYGLSDIMNNLVPIEAASSSGHTFKAYPVKVHGSSSVDGDRDTTLAVPTISGVMFKTGYARLATTIPAQGYMTAHVEYSHVEPPVDGIQTTVRLSTSLDKNKHDWQMTLTPTSQYQVFNKTMRLFPPYKKSCLVFEFLDASTNPPNFYRQGIRGAIIMTNW